MEMEEFSDCIPEDRGRPLVNGNDPATSTQDSPEGHLATRRQQRRLGRRRSSFVLDGEEVGLCVFLKANCFWTCFVVLCVCCAISIGVIAAVSPDHLPLAITLESIPIVSVLFTWGHIWLAVQMMFYPVKFKGLWNFRGSGYGIGWQGVVPRKAGMMAEKSCELMVGRLITMEEIVDRFEFDDFFETLGMVLLDCQRNVNEQCGSIYFPKLWPRLPQTIKDELLSKVMETQKSSFEPIMSDIRQNIKSILNIKDMCVTRYKEEPTLLITLFQQVGRKEFQFIQRCGAQMGLLLGIVQMGLFFITKDIDWMPWVLLPLSGLIIGNFTNWLAITLIFRPTSPRVYFNGKLIIQGLFLKRQKEASRELAAMLTDTCVNATEMIKYLVSSPGYADALEIFHKHTSNSVDEVLGYAKKVAPVALGGSEKFESMKKDIVNILLAEMPKFSSSFLKYTDQVLCIEETISTRLAALPPDEFEGMLHPAFQEDEWMLIALGGFLGVVVGLFQAGVLKPILGA
eukprot:TRINITY_DN44814_c0_g1_i1.p1 TRINITY_DN44814_c0_g1~~TRINITY_DN44814_c0_g1_i1.p1  ORF type:complete len:513 (+),score=103.49 TRINITY_DN44814_c0_g1_i1:39-1577(+)